MASYFDDLNIKVDKRPATSSRAANPDISHFFPSTSDSSMSRQPRLVMDPSTDVSQFLAVANLFGGFRNRDVLVDDEEHQQFLDNLISQLMDEANNNAKGPPPASKKFIQSLPKASKSEIPKGEECIICKDDFHTSDSIVLKLPCNHLFDKECITPWLELHHTCPACRAEFEQEIIVKEEEEDNDFMYG